MGTYNGTTFFPDPGSGTSTALDTALYIGGSLTGRSGLFQDDLSRLTPSDLSDYYKFTISSSSIVTLEMDGLTADANLFLRNSAGSSLRASSNPGTTSELIRFSLNDTPDNVFYAHAFIPIGSTATSYNLRLSAEAIQESNLANPTVDNTVAGARNIGIFTTSNTITPIIDYVSGLGQIIDAEDYYSFTLTSSGTVNIGLRSLNGTDTLYADLELRNSSSLLQSSATTGTTSESINRSLTAGTYYIRAVSSLLPGNYELNFSFTADPPDAGGNTVGTATPINLSSTFSEIVSDQVSLGDTNDYYQFTLASTSLVDIRFTSLTADANLFLQNQSGGNLISSTQSGTALDGVRLSLNAGTYNILVNRGSTDTAQYTLSASAEVIGTDQALNTTTLAQNLGSLNGSLTRSEFVGNIDTNDYYRFTLDRTSEINLNLSILSSYFDTQLVNADLQLLNSVNTQIATSNLTGNSNESISTVLNSGTYFIRVFTSGLANTFYNLNIEAKPQATLIQDINPIGNSDPANLTALGNTLYFTANDGTAGVQLWSSNGSTATRLSNITNFNPSNLIVFNNRLYFTASNSAFGQELWEYNGTSVNRISDINTGAGNSNPNHLTVAGNKLFFTAVDNSNTRKLWVYNGTSLSLVDINPSFATSSTPTFTTAFNNRLFFTAQNNRQLWSTDGTIAGTQVITAGSATNIAPRSLTVVGNTLYFTANNGTSGQEIWQYQSGTTASLLKDITPGNNSFAPSNLTAVGNTLYFVTDSDNDFNLELWKSDGTSGGTQIIGTDGVAPNLGLGAFSLTAVGSALYFVANNPGSGLELWRTDGTTTNMVKDISSGSSDSLPTGLVNFNGTLAFAASDGTSREVWFSDGTEPNTRRVSSIEIAGNANPGWLTVVGNRLFFTATDGTTGTELYVL
ncbi:pre-peptidase [Nostoc sp. CENA543]|uniref:pre-peptidase C-terminal domain-containing protein n=1 Tax=Nostoc sp. CENA543 TaxID=1869241 RepID=UPI000CA11156|nr:pre-peptidase C-terminal domain-containing protein [Nostoc sp. CENA543]AUS99311.1 pre-peptidase [Nostoc sp. CENA543]